MGLYVRDATPLFGEEKARVQAENREHGRATKNRDRNEKMEKHWKEIGRLQHEVEEGCDFCRGLPCERNDMGINTAVTQYGLEASDTVAYCPQCNRRVADFG